MSELTNVIVFYVQNCLSWIIAFWIVHVPMHMPLPEDDGFRLCHIAFMLTKSHCAVMHEWDPEGMLFIKVRTWVCGLRIVNGVKRHDCSPLKSSSILYFLSGSPRMNKVCKRPTFHEHATCSTPPPLPTTSHAVHIFVSMPLQASTDQLLGSSAQPCTLMLPSILSTDCLAFL